MHNEIMDVLPIQIKDDVIIIPRHYMDVDEVDVEVGDDYIFVRPKTNHRTASSVNEPTATYLADKSDVQDDLSAAQQDEDRRLTEQLQKKYPWIGSADGLEPDLSERVEEILASEIDHRSGWTTKPPLQD